MPRIVKLQTVLLSFLLALGCARQNIFDIEPLATGGYLIRANASTWREPVGAANMRATQDAEKFCRREGRMAKIKEVKRSNSEALIMENVEVEFDCISSAPMLANH